ncbi:MAG: DUF4124 domain-containing protein [Piscirickettsiaceae bacterium]|nr:MAG: DUF4124 domain-containing protein [Piscirickettsiaceae bacterium]
MIKNVITFILTLCLLAISTQAFSAKMYRWKDDKGGFFYSDKVPPRDSKYERATLNEKGRAISIKDASKTPKQIEQLKRIEAIQTLKNVLLKKQLAEDSALLKTFQTEADIEALVAGKLDMLDSHIKITKGQSDTLKNQLITYQKSAANYERSGRKISKKTLSNIESAQNQYDKNLAEVAAFKHKKVELNQQLEREKARFRLLAKQPLSTPAVYTAGIPSLTLGELTCTNDCPSLWVAAKAFIRKHADTRVIFESDNLFLTGEPRQSYDRTLALLAQPSGNKTLITLDIRCLNTIKGRKICRNQQTKQLATSFTRLNNK